MDAPKDCHAIGPEYGGPKIAMKTEIQSIQKEVSKLKSQIGGGELRPIYRLIGEDGSETGLVDIEGNPTERTRQDVEFTILEAPFRLLAQGKKNTVLPHGRGAGITHTLARYTLGLAIAEPCRILCAREIQLSLKQSVWYLLTAIIDGNEKLREFFVVQNDGIFGRNDSFFMFKGLRDHTAESIKSYEDILYCWVEEAQNLSRRSLDVLVPTVRSQGAQFFFSVNARKKTDPAYADYLTDTREDTSRPDKPFTIYENPLATETLRQEAETLRVRDPERHQHVYRGGIETYPEARIFHRWIVRDIDMEAVIRQRKDAIKVGHNGTLRELRERRARIERKIENSYGVGVDFGVTDPFTIVLTYLDEDNGFLYILHEFYKTKLDPDGMLQALREFPLPSPKWPVYADHRPGLIAYLWKNGINILPATKLPILERIDRLKQLDIIISPECPHAVEEFGLHSWQRDRQGVIIADQAEDKNNHIVDAVAYSLGQRLQVKKTIGKYAHFKKNPYI